MKDDFSGTIKEYYEYDYPENVKPLKTETTYIDGKRHGLCKEYFPIGSAKAFYHYVDDKKQGQMVSYHHHDIIESECNYVDDKKNGEEILYYENGNIKQRSNYVDGKRQGEVVHYHENGNVSTVANIVDDDMTSMKSYDIDGILKQETTVSDDGKLKTKFHN